LTAVNVSNTSSNPLAVTPPMNDLRDTSSATLSSTYARLASAALMVTTLG
jgi:hypothetical protein